MSPSSARHRSMRLAERRAVLLQRSTDLRGRLERDAVVLQPVFSTADRVQDAWRWAQEHTEWLLLGGLGVLLWRPRQLFRTGMRAWTLWLTARRWQKMLPALLRWL
jgi:hypothetical protein